MYNPGMNKEIKKLDSLSDRLNYALEITKTRKADLARAIGTKPQVIQFLCNSKTKTSRFSFEIATALGLNIHWLTLGSEPMFVSDDPNSQILDECVKVEVFSNKDLAKLAENKNIDSCDRQWKIIKTHYKDIYCMQINDSSMEPLIKELSYLFFICINKYKPKKGDLVIAKMKNNSSIIVRKIIEEKEILYLSPENQSLYKPIKLDDSITIFGKIFEIQLSLEE